MNNVEMDTVIIVSYYRVVRRFSTTTIADIFRYQIQPCLDTQITQRQVALLEIFLIIIITIHQIIITHQLIHIIVEIYILTMVRLVHFSIPTKSPFFSNWFSFLAQFLNYNYAAYYPHSQSQGFVKLYVLVILSIFSQSMIIVQV